MLGDSFGMANYWRCQQKTILRSSWKVSDNFVRLLPKFFLASIKPVLDDTCGQAVWLAAWWHFARIRFYGYLMSSGSNKMYLGVHVKCSIFLHDFKQISVLLTVFHKSLQYQNFKEISPMGAELRTDREDRRTDMTRVIGDIRNYAKAPRDWKYGQYIRKRMNTDTGGYTKLKPQMTTQRWVLKTDTDQLGLC